MFVEFSLDDKKILLLKLIDKIKIVLLWTLRHVKQALST